MRSSHAPSQASRPSLPWGAAWCALLALTFLSAAPRAHAQITVHVYGQALVAAQPLALGATLQAGDLAYAEVDLAEGNSRVVVAESLAIGHALTRSLSAGQGVRQANLKSRQFFAAGDTVKVLAVGNGFSVAGAGTALSPGFEGQSARVRTDSGQVVSGMPVAARQLEVAL